MKTIYAIMKRELSHYFTTPLAYVFIIIFLMLAATFTFYLGNLYERRQADLVPFFQYHPWLYLFLIPAISMRLWAEEKKNGSIELLMTLPISITQAVLGKYLAAWLFAGLALLLTFPVWLTVNYLGAPDNGVIFSSYLGSFLMAGAFLAIGSCISATTSNQVIAFIISIVICFLFITTNFPFVIDFFKLWLPQALLDTITSLSFLSHFSSINKGVIDLRDLIYFMLMIGFWLAANVVILENRKQG